MFLFWSTYLAGVILYFILVRHHLPWSGGSDPRYFILTTCFRTALFTVILCSRIIFFLWDDHSFCFLLVQGEALAFTFFHYHFQQFLQLFIHSLLLGLSQHSGQWKKNSQYWILKCGGERRKYNRLAADRGANLTKSLFRANTEAVICWGKKKRLSSILLFVLPVLLRILALFTHDRAANARGTLKRKLINFN